MDQFEEFDACPGADDCHLEVKVSAPDERGYFKVVIDVDGYTDFRHARLAANKIADLLLELFQLEKSTDPFN